MGKFSVSCWGPNCDREVMISSNSQEEADGIEDVFCSQRCRRTYELERKAFQEGLDIAMSLTDDEKELWNRHWRSVAPRTGLPEEVGIISLLTLSMNMNLCREWLVLLKACKAAAQKQRDIDTKLLLEEIERIRHDEVCERYPQKITPWWYDELKKGWRKLRG